MVMLSGKHRVLSSLRISVEVISEIELLSENKFYGDNNIFSCLHFLNYL